MTTKEYKELYEKIVALSFEWDGISKEDISSDTIKKATYIYGMLECLKDSPKRHIDYLGIKPNKSLLD